MLNYHRDHFYENLEELEKMHAIVNTTLNIQVKINQIQKSVQSSVR